MAIGQPRRAVFLAILGIGAMAILTILWTERSETGGMDDGGTITNRRAVDPPAIATDSMLRETDGSEPPASLSSGVASRRVRLRGIVVRGEGTADGAQARVAVVSSAGEELGRTQTSADGSFEVSVPESPRWSSVVAEAFDGARGIHRRGIGSDPDRIVVRIPEFATISGRVQRADGSPPAEPIEVFARDVRDTSPIGAQTQSHRLPPRDSGTHYSCRASAEGAFSIGVPAGQRYVVDVSGNGVALYEPDRDLMGATFVGSKPRTCDAGALDVVLTVGTVYLLDCIAVDPTGAVVLRRGISSGAPLRFTSVPAGAVRAFETSPGVCYAAEGRTGREADAARVVQCFMSVTESGATTGPFVVEGSIPGFESVRAEVVAVRADRYEGPQRISVVPRASTGSLLVRFEFWDCRWWDDLPGDRSTSETALGFVELLPAGSDVVSDRDRVLFELRPTHEPVRLDGIPVGTYTTNFRSQILKLRGSTPPFVVIHSDGPTELVLSTGPIGGLELNATFESDGERLECSQVIVLDLTGPAPADDRRQLVFAWPPYRARALAPGTYTYRGEYLGEDECSGSVEVVAGKLAHLDLCFRRPAANR